MILQIVSFLIIQPNLANALNKLLKEGPDRGEGGKYLILPAGYEGPVPEGGYFVARSLTTRVLILARAFLENNDPKPAVASIKEHATFGSAATEPYYDASPN